MKRLLLYSLLFISIRAFTQMEPGLISVEGFVSSSKFRYQEMFTTGKTEIKHEQRGMMLNGWISKNIFMGVGIGQLSHKETNLYFNDSKFYDGKIYRIHVGFSAKISRNKKFFAGGKLRYTQSKVHYRTDGSTNSIEGEYWSAGVVSFIGYRPCKYFMITTEPFSIESYKLAFIFNARRAEQTTGHLPFFSFNLQVHICYPILGTKKKPR